MHGGRNDNPKPGDFLITSRRAIGRGLTARQYARLDARLASERVARIGRDPRIYGTHSLRRTKSR